MVVPAGRSGGSVARTEEVERPAARRKTTRHGGVPARQRRASTEVRLPAPRGRTSFRGLCSAPQRGAGAPRGPPESVPAGGPQRCVRQAPLRAGAASGRRLPGFHRLPGNSSPQVPYHESRSPSLGPVWLARLAGPVSSPCLFLPSERAAERAAGTSGLKRRAGIVKPRPHRAVVRARRLGRPQGADGDRPAGSAARKRRPEATARSGGTKRRLGAVPGSATDSCLDSGSRLRQTTAAPDLGKVRRPRGGVQAFGSNRHAEPLHGAGRNGALA